jgi:hydrogenase maturation protein HypF
LELVGVGGARIASRHEALLAAAAAIREGRIVALKGLGGFHLMCDARNRAALETLRHRKRRPTKPFAVMMADCDEPLLWTAQAPIVLVENNTSLPREVAPGNPLLGVMRPYTPLHALLLDELGHAVVATSGNLSDEPIAIDNEEALERLGAIADVFLMHDRPILRPVDDSIVRRMNGDAVVLRRARGYAPLPLEAPVELPEMLATGAHMKSTVAFSRGRRVFVSQHLGDLATVAALESHGQAIRDLSKTYQLRPEAVACDGHPDYGSTRAAEGLGLPVCKVQHHAAHLYAGLLEHGTLAPLLAVVWDGSGWGGDGTVWGGEFLAWDGREVRRVGHLRPFSLPGGEQAVREPRRSLLGVLAEFGAEERARELFTESEWKVLRRMMAAGLNTPRTTSAGRLFDAAAALLGLRAVASFEGEAAMALEFAARGSDTAEFVEMGEDWQALFERLAEGGGSVAERAAIFHNSLVEAMVQVAARVGMQRVLLTGGCFQNALLVEKACARLRGAGFEVLTHRLLPPNDGAIAAGQILGAVLERRSCV